MGIKTYSDNKKTRKWKDDFITKLKCICWCLDRGSSSTQIYWVSSYSSVPGKQLLFKGTVGVKVTLLYASCTTVPFKKR